MTGFSTCTDQSKGKICVFRWSLDQVNFKLFIYSHFLIIWWQRFIPYNQDIKYRLIKNTNKLILSKTTSYPVHISNFFFSLKWIVETPTSPLIESKYWCQHISKWNKEHRNKHSTINGWLHWTAHIYGTIYKDKVTSTWWGMEITSIFSWVLFLKFQYSNRMAELGYC